MEDTLKPGGQSAAEIKESARRLVQAEGSLQELFRPPSSHAVAGRLEMTPGRQGVTVVLNRYNQIVYEMEREPELQGIRPGDLLRCAHGREGESGCGSSEACRFCRARLAVEACFRRGEKVTEECSIAPEGGLGDTRDFRVTCLPFRLADTAYVVAHFEDISDSKRKQKLERIFFHDILNTVAGLDFNLQLVRKLNTNPEIAPLLSNLEALSRTIQDEIISQKMLLSAEKGTLKTEKELIASLDFLEEIAATFRRREVAQDKGIRIGDFSEQVSLISDSTILRRCLGNLTLNALEASAAEDEILLSCRCRDDRVIFAVTNPAVMTPEVKAGVFNRSFSTKDENRGLGTYSVKLLTEEYLGGRTGFTSVPEEGTCFFIDLPVKKREAD